MPGFEANRQKQDIAEARDWYDGQREGFGGEFLDAVDKVLEHIEQFPQVYAVDYRRVRPAPLRRFPYVLYYRLHEEFAEVLAVCMGGATLAPGGHEHRCFAPSSNIC